MFFFFFKQKTAYEMRISDWSSDVCSSDLDQRADRRGRGGQIGDRGCRIEGALRRGAEFALGLGARTRRGAGRLRLHRLEDAREDLDGRAARGGCVSDLLSFRDRQLPSRNRENIY